MLTAAAMAAPVLSGCRTLIAATIVGCAATGPLRASRLITVGLVGAIVLGAFAYVSIALGVDRESTGTTAEGLGMQLELRLAPALSQMREMTWWQYIVGSGLGTTLEIPSLNNSIDSTYLTLAVKLGLFGVVYLYAFASVFGVGRISTGRSRGLVFFLGIVFWTSGCLGTTRSNFATLRGKRHGRVLDLTASRALSLVESTTP